jgi:hypothetical protein
MLRRLPITMALTVLLAVVSAYAAMWSIAAYDGSIDSVFRPSEGNHGVWRHYQPIVTLYDLALIGHVVAMPLTLLGSWIEKSRRAAVTMVLQLCLMLAGCAHFPLFD